MIKEDSKKIIDFAYRDCLALYDEGFTVDNLRELLTLYEEKELYLACAGIKLAINKLTNDE